MNDRTDVEISECKNLQLQKSVSVCIKKSTARSFSNNIPSNNSI